MLTIMVADRIISIATLISSSSAALFALWFGRLLDSRREGRVKRDALAVRYVFQLQTAAQLLADRLRNLTEEEGRGKMADQYFQFTTLYALACPLALERIFMLDGVYPQIKAFSKDLYPHIQGWSLDKQLRGLDFHRYDRIALAECAMVHGDSGYRLATYFEFREQYKNAFNNNDQWLEAALRFVERMTGVQSSAKAKAVSYSLQSLVDQLAEHTGIRLGEETHN